MAMLGVRRISVPIELAGTQWDLWVQVNLQEFRATFSQWAIDAGAKPESVRRSLRHRSTATSERYYARPEQALYEVRQTLHLRRTH